MSGYVQTAAKYSLRTESEGGKSDKNGEGCAHFVWQKNGRGGEREASGTRTGNEGTRQELASDLTPPLILLPSTESGRITRNYCIRPGEILSSEVTIYKNTVEIGEQDSTIQKARVIRIQDNCSNHTAHSIIGIVSTPMNSV